MASGGHILFGDFIIVTQFCGGHITVYAGFLPWSSHLSPVAIIYYAFDWKWRVGVCRRVVNWFVLKKHTLHLWSTEIRDKKRKHKHIWRMWSISSRETWTFNWLPQSPQSYRKNFFLPSYPYYQRSVSAVASFQKTCSSCLSNLSVTNSPSVASYTLQRGD